MRATGIVIALAALALGACDAGMVTGAGGDGVRPRPDSGVRASLNDDEYWTEEEYEAAGGAAATQFEANYTTYSHFSSDMRAFTGFGAVRMRMITDVDLKLNVSIVRNDNGTVLNSAIDPYYYNGIVPLFYTHDFRATVSTLNHKCGITGKASITGNGGVRAITQRDGALITVWSKDINMPAPDKTVADCQIVEECSSNIYYANGSCNESEEPAEGGEGGGTGGSGGGGGTGGGGGGDDCAHWLVIIFTIGESGEPLEIIDRYTFWECS